MQSWHGIRRTCRMRCKIKCNKRGKSIFFRIKWASIISQSSAEGVWPRWRSPILDVWVLPGCRFAIFRMQNVPDVVHYKVYRHCKHTTTKTMHGHSLLAYFMKVEEGIPFMELIEIFDSNLRNNKSFLNTKLQHLEDSNCFAIYQLLPYKLLLILSYFSINVKVVKF